MNSQVVLCRGINDGSELDRTIRELGEMLPYMESLSVVPVGLTRFRHDLPELMPFSGKDAGTVLDQIHRWQSYFRQKHGTAFVHASDEWFILAGRDFPPEDYYEGYGQLENGVGMMRLLISEVRTRLEVQNETDSSDEYQEEKRVSIATGKLAYPTICMLTREIMSRYPWIHVHVFCVENHFFGELITVTGLLTGKDIIDQLKGRDLGDELLLPCNVLKADEPLFLDDVTLSEMRQTLQVPINIIQSEGADLVDKIISKNVFEQPADAGLRYGGKDEQTRCSSSRTT